MNRESKGATPHSPLAEFLDERRPLVFLLDDNFLACPQWEPLLDDLAACGKRVSFRQGLDVRLMTPEKARKLGAMKRYSEVVFAFDNAADERVFMRGAETWRKECPDVKTKVFLLVGFYKSGLDELSDFVRRMKILKTYDFLPYVMRHEKVADDKYRAIYTEAARYCNQPAFFRRGTLVEYIERYGSAAAKRIVGDESVRRILEGV